MLTDDSNFPDEIFPYIPPIPDPFWYTNAVRYASLAPLSSKIEIAGFRPPGGNGASINVQTSAFTPDITSFTSEVQTPGGTIERTHIYVPRKPYAIIVEITDYDASVVAWTAYPIDNRKFGRISILQDQAVLGGGFINHTRTILSAPASVIALVNTDIVSDIKGANSVCDIIGIDSVVGSFAYGVSGRVCAVWSYDVFRIEYAPSSFFLPTASDCPTSFDEVIGGLSCSEALAFYEDMGRPVLPPNNALREKLIACFES